jgi:hypothetical protein
MQGAAGIDCALFLNDTFTSLSCGLEQQSRSDAYGGVNPNARALLICAYSEVCNSNGAAPVEPDRGDLALLFTIEIVT